MWILMLIKGFFGGGKLIEFISKNFKYIIILVIIGGVFYSGVTWEGRRKDREITEIHADYAKKEKDRTDAINKRIKEIEDSSATAAEELERERNKHKKDVADLLNKYSKDSRARIKKINELKKKLEELKSKGGSKELIEETERELNGLKLSYRLSPEAVTAINGLVEVYSK